MIYREEKMEQVRVMNQTTSSLPLVTVIVPAYNHEKYIETAIKSVLSQSYHPIELIVIDDGSKDNTREVVRSLKHDFDFQFIENENNLGLTKTLNKALAFANGKYISILAGDDCWLPEKTSIQVPFMEQNPDVAACSGNVKKIDKNGDPFNPHTDHKVRSISYRSFEDCMTLRARFPAIVTLVRKDVLLQIGGYDENFVMEDLPLWLRLTSTGWKIAVLPELLGYYRIHGTGLSNNFSRMFESYVRLFELYRGTPYYYNAIRALHKRQIKFGPSGGWKLMFICIWRGFAFEWEYFRNLILCFRRCLRLRK